MTIISWAEIFRMIPIAMIVVIGAVLGHLLATYRSDKDFEDIKSSIKQAEEALRVLK